MKVILHGFRCYIDEKHFEFPDDKIHLITAASGSGKTTIFMAIYWALYGSLRNVYNKTGYPKCSVTCIFNDITIYRQKKPELLKVTVTGNNKTYEDETAQGIICDMFGSKANFIACSYLQQDLKSSLLSSSPGERMDLLNELSFNGDTPDIYIERIEEELKALNARFVQQQSILKEECSKFEDIIKTKPIDQNALNICESNSESDFNTYLETLEKHIIHDTQLKRQQEDELVKQKHIQQTLLTLEQSRILYKSQIDSIPNTELETLETLAKTISEIEKKMEICTIYFEYEKQLTELNTYETSVSQMLTNILSDWKTHFSQGSYQEKVLWQIQEQEKVYMENFSLATKIGILYSAESISSELEKKKKEYDFVCQYEKYLERKKHNEYIITNIKECSDKISECTKHFQYLESRLQGTSTLSDLTNTLSLLKQKLMDIETRKKIFNTLTIYRQQIKHGEEELIKLKSEVSTLEKDYVSYDTCTSIITVLTTYNGHRKNSYALEKDILCIQEKLVKLKEDLVQCVNKISQLPDILELENTIHDSKNNLNTLELATKLLSCPHCSGTVQVYDGKLHKCSQTPISQSDFEEEKRKISSKQMLLNQLKQLINQKNTIEQEVLYLEKLLCDKQKLNSEHLLHIEELTTTFTQFSSSSILDISLQDLEQQKIKTLEISKKLNNLKLRITNIENTLLINTEKVRQEEENLSTFGALQDEDLQDEILRKQISDITNLIEETNTKTSDLKTIQFQIQCLNSQKQQLEKQRFSVNNVDNVNNDEIFSTFVLTGTGTGTSSDPMNSQTLLKLITEITNIKYIEKPVISSKVYEAFLGLSKCREHISQITKLKFTTYSGLEPLKQKHQYALELSQLKKDYLLMTENYKKVQELTVKLHTIEERLKEEEMEINPNLENAYSETCTRLNSNVLTLETYQYTYDMLCKQKKLAFLHHEVTECQLDITALQNLYQTSIVVECKRLQEITDMINIYCTEICSKIFDDPISVTLNLFKTQKSDKRIKPNVNLTINYNGVEYDSVSQLSGGEAVRVSIALILSLAKVSDTRILLLDECFGALNASLREDCLKTIRKYVSKNTTVLVISHEDVEGYYDSVISSGFAKET